MTLQLFSNNGVSLLASDISPSDMSIQLQAGLGKNFPRPVIPGEFFLVTLENINAPLEREIIRIIGRTGDTLVVGARAQEGTTAQAWTAFETLVDHRITAETIKQAFLQPVNTGGGGGGDVIQRPPVLVEPTWTQGVASAVYSDTRRSNKFWVSMYSPNNKLAQSFELLTVVQGDLAANSEVVFWTKSNRIGHNFSGSVGISLDKPNNTLNVTWNSTEQIIDVVVSVVQL